MLRCIVLLVTLTRSCLGGSLGESSDTIRSSKFSLSFYSLSPSVDAASVLVPSGYWKISDNAVTTIKCPMYGACLGAEL